MLASDRLFHADPLERLAAARALPQEIALQLQSSLSEAAPVRPWPYGMPTVLNPWVVFLGPSPGAPGRGDPSPGTEAAYSAPTIGEPHPKIYHPAQYFTQIREAAEVIIRRIQPEACARDCHALLGNLNLSTRQDGQAVRSGIEPLCGDWVPRLIVEQLRPRVVIAVGLLGFMSRAQNRTLFDPGGLLKIDWRLPDVIRPFRAYTAQSLLFRVWERQDCIGNPITVVAWPNHPSRVPFNQPSLWTAAAAEFAEWMVAR